MPSIFGIPVEKTHQTPDPWLAGRGSVRVQISNPDPYPTVPYP
jgi:hypothetical protein